MGSSSKVDVAAREFVNLFGRDKLAEVAKLNFKNTARILEGLT